MEKLTQWWYDFFQAEHDQANWWTRKKELCRERGAEIVRINGRGHLHEQVTTGDQIDCHYLLCLTYLIKQDDYFYREEQIIPYQCTFNKSEIIHHAEQPQKREKSRFDQPLIFIEKDRKEKTFSYDRRAAVSYAEHWWNSYNPEFPRFAVDCTNYVSQCLLAGGVPMHGAPVKERGWWYQNNQWSFSWAVAHSMRWYLSGATTGLIAKEMAIASELYPGDVICYDFEGDGRWDHTTIVVEKDAYNMPLVNAHTDNSRHRYWSYEDSTAWTPEIKYKFFRIGE